MTRQKEVETGTVSFLGTYDFLPTFPKQFQIYLQFIYSTEPADLHKLAKAHYLERINRPSSFGDLSDSQAQIWIYSRCWRMGHYLGDDSFKDAAMRCLLERVRSPDLVAFVKIQRLSGVLGSVQRNISESGLFRWVVDCVASAINDDDLNDLWNQFAERDDFIIAVVKKLLEFRKTGPRPPTVEDFGLYQDTDMK